jgi:lipopolysaccharide transport system permease protein
VRYKQSLLGVGWAVLHLLVLTSVSALFFGHLAKVRSNGFPYPLFALSGLVP